MNKTLKKVQVFLVSAKKGENSIYVELPTEIVGVEGDVFVVAEEKKFFSLKSGGNEQHNVRRDTRAHLRDHLGLSVTYKEQYDLINVNFINSN